MKKGHRILFKLLVCNLLLIFAVAIFCVSYFFAVTADTTLETDKLKTASANSLVIFDNTGTTTNIDLINSKANLVSYSQLPQFTVDAFVCTEDKRFFEHKGIDYIRLVGAIKNNILHPNRKQGGSTITQQVIKNTQLSSERTIDRKLKEFKLARQMEKQFTKQEIFETYVNSIYFGNGCYGIANASDYYFDKPVEQLTIAESALLAATINAPSVYDPVSNKDKAFKRKDLVLDLMNKYNKIDDDTLKNCKNEQIEIEKAYKRYKNQYYKGVIAEACSLLKVTENQLLGGQYKIYSYYDAQIQSLLQKQIENGKYTIEQNSKLGAIVLDNNMCGVVALAGNTSQNLLNTYRQPGSVIKPILVYAPAFESGKYSPATYVDDSKISINGYSPENAGKLYNGMVTVRESLTKSLNIPAVKILDSIGLANGKAFASNMGINFSDEDNNLALALGGFTKGTTIKQLCDAYMCFANSGNYAASSFIKQIEDNAGNTIYSREINYKKVCSSATSYLVSSCLYDVAKTGTAKRLAELNLPLYSKTGTVGQSSGNTDAYNVTYSNQHTMCCWIGANDRSNPLPSSVNGATYPTLFNKAICQDLYANNKPKLLETPDTVATVALNEDALLEYKLEADDNGTTTEIFNINYMPPATLRSKLDTTLTANNFSETSPELKFDAKRTVAYKIYRSDGNCTIVIKEYKFSDGNISYVDTTAKQGNIYDYWIEAELQGKTKISNHIKLIAN